jgi:hypothetical protein
MTERDTDTELVLRLATIIYEADRSASRASLQRIAQAIIEKFDLKPRNQPAEADPTAFVSRASTR